MTRELPSGTSGFTYRKQFEEFRKLEKVRRAVSTYVLKIGSNNFISCDTPLLAVFSPPQGLPDKKKLKKKGGQLGGGIHKKN